MKLRPGDMCVMNDRRSLSTTLFSLPFDERPRQNYYSYIGEVEGLASGKYATVVTVVAVMKQQMFVYCHDIQMFGFTRLFNGSLV